MALTKVTFSMIQGAMVNVLDYMSQSQIAAVRSATTVNASVDVTAEIQAAIAAAAALPTGATVYFPSGLYKTTNTIDVPNKVSLLGEAYPQTNGTGTAWNSGPCIYKAHNNDAITVISANESTWLTNIGVWSDKTVYTAGNGIVMGPSAGCVLQSCVVRNVAGDSFVIGDNTSSSYTNMAFDCYSNNPGGRNFVVGGLWFRGERLISDGGTFGLHILQSSNHWTIGEVHFEGFTLRGIKIEYGNGQFFGHNILLPYVGNIIGIELANVSGVQNIVIDGFYIYAAASVPNYNGIQISGNYNVAITVQNCTIQGFGGGGVADLGKFNKVLNCDIYGCSVGIYAGPGSDAHTYMNNIISGTTGANSMEYYDGTSGLWTNNRVDKTIYTVTGIPGYFNGVCVKGNPGYKTYAQGITVGTIASGTKIAHGLVGNPLAATTPGGFVSATSLSGAVPDLYLSAADATDITFSWTGGASRQLNWTARCPCDF